MAFYFGEFNIKKYFALMLILIGVLQFFSANFYPPHIPKTKNIPLIWMLLIGTITGIVGGLFGIGAGILMIPIFLMVFNMDKNYARALTMGILLPPVSLGAFMKYYQQDAIDWTIVFSLFISYFIANYFGVKRGSAAHLASFKRIYALLLITIAVVYWLQIYLGGQ